MFWMCKFCRVKMPDAHRFCSKCCGKRAYAELKSELCPSCQSKGFAPKMGMTALGKSFQGCVFCCNETGGEV